jgi:hypothetical protein
VFLLLETVWKSAVGCLVEIAVDKGVYCVQLEGLKIIDCCYGHKGLKDARHKRCSVGVFVILLLQVSSDTYAGFEFDEISVGVEFIREDPVRWITLISGVFRTISKVPRPLTL